MAMATTAMLRGGGGSADPLWAQVAELERQFEGYKRRLAEKSTALVDRRDVGVVVDDGGTEEVGRGRRYDAYVRRRDEKLRQGWLARMERKEAEVKALWARLDAGGRRRGPDDAASSPAREQKARSIVPAAATTRCISALKLPRLRSAVPSSSPAAASPRLPTSRRTSHPEAPTTPRKENRMPPSPLKTLSRTRSSLKDSGSKVERSSGSSSSSSSSTVTVRESPRPPRAPAPSAADAAIAAARSRFHEQVVLAEIKTAAVVSPGPLRLRRSRIGVTLVSSPSMTPGQVDFLSRLGTDDDRETSSERADAEGLNSNTEAGVGDAEITGDSDTEPSYVYIKRDHEEAGDEHQEAEIFEETMASSSPPSETTVKESPGTATEASSRDSSESLYSNVQSSFSQGSELDASAAGSPLPTPPPASGGALSTEELLESDAALLRMKREQEEVDASEEEEDQSIVFLPTKTSCAVSVTGRPQSPTDAVAGLKRFLAFGKKNGKGADDTVVVIERAPPPAGDAGGSQASAASCDPIKPRTCWSDAASDDPDDNSYVIPPHVRSLQSFVPTSPARSQLKEMALPAKSPRVNRSFFSFSSFKNRGN